MPDCYPAQNDDTDVAAALARTTQDGPGDIPAGAGDYEEGAK